MCVHGMCMCVCVHTHTVQYTPSQDALAGRVNPLRNVSPLANRNMLEEEVDQELQIQFLVGKCKQPLVYHSIIHLNKCVQPLVYHSIIHLNKCALSTDS